MVMIGTALHGRAIDCWGETGAASGKEPHVQCVSWYGSVLSPRSSNKNHGGSVDRCVNEAVGIRLLSIFLRERDVGRGGEGGGCGG
ncbi:unnamed protein product [Ectocarpus sp. 13 AM-2016]